MHILIFRIFIQQQLESYHILCRGDNLAIVNQLHYKAQFYSTAINFGLENWTGLQIDTFTLKTRENISAKSEQDFLYHC